MAKWVRYIATTAVLASISLVGSAALAQQVNYAELSQAEVNILILQKLDENRRAIEELKESSERSHTGFITEFRAESSEVGAGFAEVRAESDWVQAEPKAGTRRIRYWFISILSIIAGATLGFLLSFAGYLAWRILKDDGGGVHYGTNSGFNGREIGESRIRPSKDNPS